MRLHLLNQMCDKIIKADIVGTFPINVAATFAAAKTLVVKPGLKRQLVSDPGLGYLSKQTIACHATAKGPQVPGKAVFLDHFPDLPQDIG